MANNVKSEIKNTGFADIPCDETIHRDDNHIDDADYNSSESLLPKLHAEINCLNQLKHLDINFSKVKLYIYRTRKDIECGMANEVCIVFSTTALSTSYNLSFTLNLEPFSNSQFL